MARGRGFVIAAMALMLTGCGGGSMPSLTGGEETVKTGMAGRWLLQAPRAPSCGVELSQSSDGRSGRVVPEGGCPTGFYRARRWALDGGTMTIRDDNGDTVGQLSQAGESFDGKTAAGIPITLTRPAPPPTE